MDFGRDSLLRMISAEVEEIGKVLEGKTWLLQYVIRNLTLLNCEAVRNFYVIYIAIYLYIVG